MRLLFLIFVSFNSISISVQVEYALMEDDIFLVEFHLSDEITMPEIVGKIISKFLDRFYFALINRFVRVCIYIRTNNDLQTTIRARDESNLLLITRKGYRAFVQ